MVLEIHLLLGFQVIPEMVHKNKVRQIYGMSIISTQYEKKEKKKNLPSRLGVQEGRRYRMNPKICNRLTVRYINM